VGQDCRTTIPNVSIIAIEKLNAAIVRFPYIQNLLSHHELC